MNKYEAARKIQMPRAGIARISSLPLAKRVMQKLNPDAHFRRLHEAHDARIASFHAAVQAVMVKYDR